MLTIETGRRVSTEVSRLPLVTRIGVLLLPVAAALDVFVHLAAGEHAASGGHSGVEHMAHLLGVVGMVLVLAGVVAYGARRQLNRRRDAADRRSSDAIR
jgi:hypothetical protein